MKVKQLFLSYVLVFFIMSVQGQEYRVSGVIMDSKSRETLPYATILLKNTIYGGQADVNGNFSIDFPSGYDRDSVSVRMLAYEEKVIAVTDMGKGMGMEILLTPKEQVLDEVVIYATSPIDILKKASENWEKNHKIKSSQIQRCFSRELVFESGKCCRVGEAILDKYTVVHSKDSIRSVRRILKARGIQDSAKMWHINDIFRLKKDTISMDMLFSGGLAGADLSNMMHFFSKEDSVKEKSKERDKSTVNFTVQESDVKYAGLVKHNNRSTHRILISLLLSKEKVMEGQLLIDSATYGYAGIQLSNQRVDLYKKIVPWYAKAVIRLMGYKPVVKDANFSSQYKIMPDGKWVKTYDYMRYGGAVTKKKRTLDGYIQNEFYYENPRVEFFSDTIKSNFKEFEEISFVESDSIDFWKPYIGISTPSKVKSYIADIKKSNMDFEGSIGYNRKESRRRKKELRRKKRKGWF